MDQISFSIRPHPRGFHLITSQVLKAIPFLKSYKTGILHLFICHTSASLTLNENADSSVRVDIESYFNRLVPDKTDVYTHNAEGADDMPAHIKTAILDTSLILPVSAGKLALGTWQGIYLCEHRNHAASRNLIATVWGEMF